MLETLNDWLGNYDYHIGLKLYEESIGEDALFQLISTANNSFTKGKLIASLQGVADKLTTELKQRLAEKPEEIKCQERRAQQLMNERSELKAMLRAQYLEGVDNRSSRTAAVMRIAAIRPELDKCFMNVQIYNEQGVVVDTAEDIEDQDSMQEMLNIRTYVTKYQKCLKESLSLAGTPLSKKLEGKYQQKLAAWKLQLLELEKSNADVIFNQ